jgi:hypothetical protein
MPLTVQTDIPMIETRGRPPSEEHVKLLTMKIGHSFVSSKSRDSLYQIARTLQVKVKILTEGDGLWRVWKRSAPGEKHTVPKVKRKSKSED